MKLTRAYMLEQSAAIFHREVAQYQLEQYNTYGGNLDPMARGQLRKERDDFIALKRQEMKERNKAITP